MKEKHLPGSINNRIRELRERDKMTQAELAAKLGVSPSTLGRIEKGEIEKVSSDILVKLARIFEVSTDFLLGVTDYPDRMNYEVGQLGLTRVFTLIFTIATGTGPYYKVIRGKNG